MAALMNSAPGSDAPEVTVGKGSLVNDELEERLRKMEEALGRQITDK